MKIEFGKEDIINAKDFFFSELEKSGEPTDSTPPSMNGALIVPSVYLLKSDFIELEDHLAIPGLMFQIHSFEKAVYFVLEVDHATYMKGYDAMKSNVINLLKVERKNIIGFEDTGIHKYTAIKPKKSYQFLYNLGPAGIAGGLISGAIQRGAVKLAAKIEGDIQINEGNIYSLKCKVNNDIVEIRVACEKGYKNYFEDFLKNQWTTSAPKPFEEEQSKGGCFIATACYGSYDHEKVMFLRNFRDQYLAERSWGQKFIATYYRLSPPIADKISKSRFQKRIVKHGFIIPLIGFIKIFRKY